MTPGRPHPERLDADYVEKRIHQKIEAFDEEDQREGFRNIDAHLQEAGVDPSVRLHYVSAVRHLARIGEETKAPRIRHGETAAEHLPREG